MFKKPISESSRVLVQTSKSAKIVAAFLKVYTGLVDGDPKKTIFGPKPQLGKIQVAQHTTLYTFEYRRPNPQTGEEEVAWEPVFYEYKDPDSQETKFVPHLKLVHRFPSAFPNRIRIDRGAIRFVLSGAALMVPGLTSPGGRLPGESDKDGEGKEAEYRYGSEDFPAGEIVVVEAEGKEHACMVGPLKMGTKDMKTKKKGIAMDMGHYLNDSIWNLEPNPAKPPAKNIT